MPDLVDFIFWYLSRNSRKWHQEKQFELTYGGM